MVQPPKTTKIPAPDPEAQIKDEIMKADLGQYNIKDYYLYQATNW